MDQVPILWPWQGSKGRLAQIIAQHMPPHRVYVEPFAGTAAVLLAKVPSPVEILNDSNGDLVAVYRCLQDPQKTRRLLRRIYWTPWSRQEWQAAREPVENAGDEVDQAARFLVRMFQGFNGIPNNSAWSGGKQDSAYHHRRKTLFLRRAEWVARRLERVALECGDWETVVRRYESPDALIYCDPPYFRTDANYGTRWKRRDQERLVQWLVSTPAMVMLSSYDHPTFRPLHEAGWHVERFRVMVNLVARTAETGRKGAKLPADDVREELLWWSPSAWAQARRQMSVFDLLEAHD